MRCCLVVATYERPDALERVLASLATQTRWPDEVVIADDGSGPDVGRLVRGFANSAPVTVRHAWQPHQGFRAGRARNLAIAGTRCEYVILLDGDMVMHPDFVADHLAAARAGHWSQGVRVVLDDAATERLLHGADLPGFFSPGLGLLRRSYALRVPGLARALRTAANGLIAVKACNQAFWRADLLAVNGFDEAMVGWGAEDKELCARLANHGVVRQTLLFSAIAFHLAHPPASRANAAANAGRWRQTVRSGRTRCERGIDDHGPV